MSKNNTDNLIERFEDNRDMLIRATGNSILQSTVLFFHDKAKGKQSALGSGLLFSLDQKFFMITAAHVIGEKQKEIYVILSDKEIQLGGLLLLTPIPISGKRDDDKIDIAIMHLTDSSVADLLQNFKFIELENIGISYKKISQANYLVVGYPATKTKKVWGKDEIKSKPFVYRSKENEIFNYAKFGFSNKLHIAVKFDGKVVSTRNKNLHKAPNLHGISGCGLWYLKDFGKPSMIDNKQLVGVVIEQKKYYGHNAIIATRIDLITEAIRQQFDVVIPKSKTIKVNLQLGSSSE
jgi:hypothetical protein